MNLDLALCEAGDTVMRQTLSVYLRLFDSLLHSHTLRSDITPHLQFGCYIIPEGTAQCNYDDSGFVKNELPGKVAISKFNIEDKSYPW